MAHLTTCLKLTCLKKAKQGKNQSRACFFTIRKKWSLYVMRQMQVDESSKFELISFIMRTWKLTLQIRAVNNRCFSFVLNIKLEN